jgi:MFS family permease
MDDNNIKNLVKQAGNKNRYQYITLFIIFLIYGSTEFITISLPYLETRPTVEFFDSNGIRHEMQINYTICESYKYNITKNVSSIVSDTKLYCDKTGTSLIGMSLFCGVMIGSLILYFFADMWGRKKTILIFSVLYVGSLLLTYFIENNIYVYYTAMFFSGMFYVIVLLTSIILLNEAISEDLNSIFTTIIYNSYFLYGMGYGYMLRLYDWKTLYVIVAVLHIIFVTFFYIYCEESLYFYLTKNDRDNFLKTLEAVARKNGRSLSGDYNFIKYEEGNIQESDMTFQKRKDTIDSTQIKLQMKSLEEYGILDLLKFKSQRYNFLILCYLWLISSFIFYGLSLNIKNNAGNIYTNIIIVYTLDIIFTTICSFLSNTSTLGRTKTVTLLLLISFISNMIYEFKPDTEENASFFDDVLLVSQYSYTCLLCIIYFVSNEIYPTVLRAKGLGYNSAAGRIGGIIAPLLIEHINSDSLVNILILLTIMGIMFSFFITETYGQDIKNKLPEENDSYLQS